MTATTSSIKVKTIDHVTIVVKDLEASRRFYVDLLGMEQVERPGFSFDGRWFQAGDTQIHLILQHEASGPAGQSVADDSVKTRTHHFAFIVDDAVAAAERAREMNVPIVSEPKQRPDGAVQTFLCDPDGYIVELCMLPRSSS